MEGEWGRQALRIAEYQVPIACRQDDNHLPTIFGSVG